MKILIVASEFNDFITKPLVEGATATLKEAGLKEAEYPLVWVPGAFELPAVAARAARSNGFDAVICLGAVIRGGTPHFDYVAGEAAAGLMQVSIETTVPIVFGVLTTDDTEQALARCGIKGGNKGVDAAKVALQMIKVNAQVDELAK